MRAISSIARRSVVATAALAITATGAFAQTATPRTFNIGLAGGLAVPTGDYAEGRDLAAGFTGLAYIGFQPRFQPLGFRLEADVSRNSVEFLEESVEANITQIGGAANVVLTIANDGNFRPYAIGGVGAYNIRYDDRFRDFDDQPNETKLGLNGGIGAKFRLGALNAFVEGRYKSVFLDNDRKLNTIPIVFGIEF